MTATLSFAVAVPITTFSVRGRSRLGGENPQLKKTPQQTRTRMSPAPTFSNTETAKMQPYSGEPFTSGRRGGPPRAGSYDPEAVAGYRPEEDAPPPPSGPVCGA